MMIHLGEASVEDSHQRHPEWSIDKLEAFKCRILYQRHVKDCLFLASFQLSIGTMDEKCVVASHFLIFYPIA
jgi:hypothetical protein